MSVYKRKVSIMAIILSLSIAVVAESTVHAWSISGKGAILMEQDSGRVLYAKNEHQQMRIASITKIMTAILAIESGKMDEMVTVTSNAAGTEGSSLYLRAGEKMKLEDLVYGLMLRSGNDSAVAIAEHVGGSLEGFVYMMNEKAEEIGMNRTVFSNPHGLDDHEEHYSTAYDMAILTQYAMENEQYRTIVGTEKYRVAQEGENWDRIWRNKNRLLTQLYKHSTGGKTGYTRRAKRTLVSTASKDDLDLITVTLNAPSDWHDHMHLFDWAFDRYEQVTLVEQGLLKGIDEEFYKDKVSASYTLRYPLTKEEKSNIDRKITLYRPPTNEEWRRRGIPQPVGRIDVSIHGEKIGNVPIYYTEPIDDQEQGFWQRVKSMFFFTVGVNRLD